MMIKGLMGLTLAVAALAAPAVAAADGYELERRWAVDQVSSLAVGSGSVAVVSTVAGTVTRYTPRGRRVTSWSGDLDRPGPVAIAPGGEIYVADAGRRIAIFDRGGRTVGGGPLIGPAGAPELAWDIDVDRTGDTFVAFYGNVLSPPVIARYSAAGQGLASWGGLGEGDGQFSGALAIASDGRGNVYVADRGAHRVQRFSATGAYLGQWGQIGRRPGQFIEPSGIAVDARGDVYVSDESNGRVQKFDPRGRLKAVIDLRRHAISPEPVDVAVDRRGDVYVADRGNPEATYVFSRVRCGEAKRRVKRARRAVSRLKARDASPRRIRAAKRKAAAAKRLRRAAC